MTYMHRCKKCDVGFLTGQVLGEHYRTSHGKNEPETSTDYWCSRCEGTFGTHLELGEHLKEHSWVVSGAGCKCKDLVGSGPSPWECPDCERLWTLTDCWRRTA